MQSCADWQSAATRVHWNLQAARGLRYWISQHSLADC